MKRLIFSLLFAAAAATSNAATVPTLNVTVSTDTGRISFDYFGVLELERTRGVQSVPAAIIVNFDGPEKYFSMMMGYWSHLNSDIRFWGARDFSHNGLYEYIASDPDDNPFRVNSGQSSIERSIIAGNSAESPLIVNFLLWDKDFYSMSRFAKINLSFNFADTIEEAIYVPVPASIAFMFSGVAALLGSRLMRRA